MKITIKIEIDQYATTEEGKEFIKKALELWPGDAVYDAAIKLNATSIEHIIEKTDPLLNENEEDEV